MFNLCGILEDGNTAVGTVSKNGQDYLIGVCLLTRPNSSQSKETIKKIKDSLASGNDSNIISVAKELPNIFNDCSSPVLSVSISSPLDAMASIESILDSQYRKLLFICSDKESFLTTCSELSMRRQDFFNFAELKYLLKENFTESAKGVVGSAHKLAQSMARGNIEICYWAEHQKKRSLGIMATDIIESQKFLVKDDKWHPEEDEFLFYPGDYRLPFHKCLFEYDYVGKDPNTQNLIPVTSYILVYDFGGIYNGYIFDYYPKDRKFISLGFGPRWQVKENGDIDNFTSVAIDPIINELYDEKIIQSRSYSALRRIGATIAAMNEPRATITTYDPPSKLQKHAQRKGKIPFFTYKEISIEDIKDEDGNIIRGNSIAGRKGMALHMVRGHLKPSIDKWISPYSRGNPQLGVIHKSFTG